VSKGSYRVYAPDTVGQPGRSTPTRPPHVGPAFGHWLIDVMDGLDINQAVVVGWSLGGRIVIKLGGLVPERLTRAVLVSPMGFKVLRAGLFARLLPVAFSLRSLQGDKMMRMVGEILAPSIDLEDRPDFANYLVI
jgi:pimeloyl-ACP methyl ester carboxylesterase